MYQYPMAVETHMIEIPEARPPPVKAESITGTGDLEGRPLAVETHMIEIPEARPPPVKAESITGTGDLEGRPYGPPHTR
jgi:hypothetical protein